MLLVDLDFSTMVGPKVELKHITVFSFWNYARILSPYVLECVRELQQRMCCLKKKNSYPLTLLALKQIVQPTLIHIELSIK